MNTINNLITDQPMLHSTSVYGSFKGIYFLSSLVVKFDRYGRQFVCIKLSDVLHSIHVNCFLPHALTMLAAPNVPVYVEIKVSELDSSLIYTCTAIENVPFSDFVRYSGMYGLPLAILNVGDIQKRFFNILEKIYSQHLIDFLAASLLQHHICLNYCLCPASLNYHHNYLGGLIQHSIEVAESVISDESLSESEKQIGIVAALVHDIGKTKTMTPDLNRTSIGYFVDHDNLSLEICANAMGELEKRNEADAIQLRHALTCNTSGASSGYKAKTRLAVALKLYDRDSSNRYAKPNSMRLLLNKQINATN
ncbi:HDIG domain-containing metalloprotein [Glaciecola sp. SC05]|uniref:HDIG domain-containing metalloprotein n=1 Tax=Glaciecola sp. SC05 TaxID=1987355 RepID=UPI0035297594